MSLLLVNFTYNGETIGRRVNNGDDARITIHGAGLFSQAAQTRVDVCHFEHNKAAAGGAMYTAAQAPATRGLPKLVPQNFTVTNSKVVANSASAGNGGGVFSEISVLVEDTNIVGNYASEAGGGLAVIPPSSLMTTALTLIRSNVSNNTACAVGGAVSFSGFSSSTSGTSGSPGGSRFAARQSRFVFNSVISVSATHSSQSARALIKGGALFLKDCNATIERCEISDNQLSGAGSTGELQGRVIRVAR